MISSWHITSEHSKNKSKTNMWLEGSKITISIPYTSHINTSCITTQVENIKFWEPIIIVLVPQTFHTIITHYHPMFKLIAIALQTNCRAKYLLHYHYITVNTSAIHPFFYKFPKLTKPLCQFSLTTYTLHYNSNPLASIFQSPIHS